jgi:3-oxoacyl-[acyl-carrier-protein] synthase-3
MIGIAEIGTYLPEQEIDNLNRIDEFEIDETFLREKTGMLKLSVKEPEEDTSDLCSKAFYDLQQKTGIDPLDIDCIIVCTQNPDGNGLPHTSAIVHSKLNLADRCAAFDISLGCSGYVYGLSIIESFMESNSFSNGILFTADPYSKVVDKHDKNTSLLFGDAATATLVNKSPKWTSGKYTFGTHGSEYKAIQINASDKLEMNGRSVFSFSATAVPKNIDEMLSANNITKEDVDCFALHQGSKYIVETIRNRLNVSKEKCPFVASEYGNTVSSSIPLLLAGLDDSISTVVISGFGVGLSWSSTVLMRKE